MFINGTNKFLNLVITGLVDVDGFIISIQACNLARFPTAVNGHE